jgi:hypothetical protein
MLRLCRESFLPSDRADEHKLEEFIDLCQLNNYLNTVIIFVHFIQIYILK